MKNYLPLAVVLFFVSSVCSSLLFVGLFSANIEYIKSSIGDTIFVLVVGTLIPITLISGFIMYIKGLRNEEKDVVLLTIISIVLALYSIFVSGVLFGFVLELYGYVFGIR